MAKAKNKVAGGFLRGGKIIWISVAVLLVLVFVGSLQLLRGVYETETYYVLNQNVPTRTQIVFAPCDADGQCGMLQRVTTQAGTGPIGAPGMTNQQRLQEQETLMTAVSGGEVYSRFPLVAGDVLSPSNVDVGLTGITSGIPDEWVTTNISVAADFAVGGRIQRGTYFDILVVNDAGAYYPFVNVLALDTSVDLNSASSADAADSAEAKDGQTSQYVVGMNPENAAKLQYLMKTEGANVRLVLSPQQNEYSAPDLFAYTGLFTYEIGDSVIAPGLREMEVTDSEGNVCTVTREATRNDFTQVTDEPVDGIGNARNPEGFLCSDVSEFQAPEETEGDSSIRQENEPETDSDNTTDTDSSSTTEDEGTETPAPSN